MHEDGKVARRILLNHKGKKEEKEHKGFFEPQKRKDAKGYCHE